MKREIQLTADGSKTLFVEELDEHYHSTKGALTESQHIFINMGLKECDKPQISVLEIGFGTGLNAMLTLLYANERQQQISYTGLEKFPLEPSVIDELEYGSHYFAQQQALFRQLHTAAWDADVAITPYFTLHKCCVDFTTYRHSRHYDVIYFDAFAPEKQPEMWSESLFTRLYHSLNPGGILTTYCAKGVVRRMMQSIGFVVERIPGPPGGKREILRARKPKSL